MPVIDILATIENQRSSHIGTCFDTDKPVAFDTSPTKAVTAKWKPVNVVAEIIRKIIPRIRLIESDRLKRRSKFKKVKIDKI